MSWSVLARVGKVVALLGFLLPWLVVSCQGSPMLTASGLDLAVGHASGPAASNPQIGHGPQAWALIALALVLIGLANSFTIKALKSRGAAIAVTSTSAFLLCVVGMMMMISGAHRDMAKSAGASNPWDASAQQMAAQGIKIDTQAGYWLTLIGLLGGGVAGASLYLGRAEPAALASLSFRLAAVAPSAGSDPDTAYWDRIADKTDHAALEEYLVRYPEGRFAELARTRLART